VFIKESSSKLIYIYKTQYCESWNIPWWGEINRIIFSFLNIKGDRENLSSRGYHLSIIHIGMYKDQLITNYYILVSNWQL